LGEFLADFSIELNVRPQRFESFDSMLESGYGKGRQLLTSKKCVDSLPFFWGKDIGPHVGSFILWEAKVLSTFYPYNRDNRVLRSLMKDRKTRLKRKQPQ